MFYKSLERCLLNLLPVDTRPTAVELTATCEISRIPPHKTARTMAEMDEGAMLCLPLTERQREGEREREGGMVSVTRDRAKTTTFHFARKLFFSAQLKIDMVENVFHEIDKMEFVEKN